MSDAPVSLQFLVPLREELEQQKRSSLFLVTFDILQDGGCLPILRDHDGLTGGSGLLDQLSAGSSVR